MVMRGFSRLEWNRMPAGGISTYHGGAYCGPGWGFTADDVASGRLRELPHAIDAIDAACRRHDQCYADRGYFAQDCNLALSRDLVAILLSKGSSYQQRLDAAVMAGVFGLEALIVDPVVGEYRQLRNSFETLFRQGFSMEAIINRHMR
jgi:hypothetical protein